MDCIELNLISTFADIFDRAHTVAHTTSCENALLALEAARIGMPTEDFTAKYRAYINEALADPLSVQSLASDLPF